MSKYLLYLKHFDWILFSVTILLLSLGLLGIYSLTLNNEKAYLLIFNKQLIFVIIGIIFLFLMSFVDHKLLFKISRLFYLLGILMLVAVLFFGVTVKGTKGWFFLGPVSFQPIEFVKLTIVITLATFFYKQGHYLKDYKIIIKSGLLILPFLILLLWQPDLGSSIIIFLLWITLLILTGIKRRHLFLLFLFIILLSAIFWFFLFKNYQKERVMSFFRPHLDIRGANYNLTQSLIAIGSGGLVGQGLGQGTQSQLRFLPQAQNDFIFALIAEELGMIGGGLLLFFWSLFFFRLIKIAKTAKNDFSLFLTCGIFILLMSQVVINISVNIGFLPITGLSLPLLSYGGSALVMNLIMVGIIQNINIQSKLHNI